MLHRYLVISEKLEEIKSFRELTCLDLSCCKLGDEHELLEHLTNEALSRYWPTTICKWIVLFFKGSLNHKNILEAETHNFGYTTESPGEFWKYRCLNFILEIVLLGLEYNLNIRIFFFLVTQVIIVYSKSRESCPPWKENMLNRSDFLIITYTWKEIKF